MNPYGNHERLRCLLLGGCLFVAAGAIGVATDEAGASWAARAARLGALGPLVAGLAAAACASQARRSGATRALLGLGVAPWDVHRGERQGAWMLGCMGLALVLAPWSDPGSLFPHIDGSAAWQRLANGTLHSQLGVTWTPHGGFASALVVHQPAPSWRLASLALLAPACAVVPPWVLSRQGLTTRGGLLSAAAALTLTSVASLALVHAVAAQRISTLWLSLACAPLLLQTLRRPRPATQHSPTAPN